MVTGKLHHVYIEQWKDRESKHNKKAGVFTYQYVIMKCYLNEQIEGNPNDPSISEEGISRENITQKVEFTQREQTPKSELIQRLHLENERLRENEEIHRREQNKAQCKILELEEEIEKLKLKLLDHEKGMIH